MRIWQIVRAGDGREASSSLDVGSWVAQGRLSTQAPPSCPEAAESAQPDFGTVAAQGNDVPNRGVLNTAQEPRARRTLSLAGYRGREVASEPAFRDASRPTRSGLTRPYPTRWAASSRLPQ